MVTRLRLTLRVGAACYALVLSTAAAAPASELQIAASEACETRHDDHIRATFSAAREQIRLKEQLVADLKRIRSQLTGQRTWWGGDATSDTSLAVAVVLRNVKTTADLTFDLAESAAAMMPATQSAACSIGALKAPAEQVVLRDGDSTGLAVNIARCTSKSPGNWFFETVDTLKESLVDDVVDTIYLVR